MKRIRQIIAATFGICAVTIFAVTAVIEIFYLRRQGISGLDDYLIYTLPIVAPLVAFGANIAIFLLSIDKPIWKGCLWGIFIAANLFLVIPILQLVMQYQLIAHDGTAFWAMMFLPVFFIGLPMWIIGPLLGCGIAIMIRKMKTKTEPSHSAYHPPAAGSA